MFSSHRKKKKIKIQWVHLLYANVNTFKKQIFRWPISHKVFPCHPSSTEGAATSSDLFRWPRGHYQFAKYLFTHRLRR